MTSTREELIERIEKWCDTMCVPSVSTILLICDCGKYLTNPWIPVAERLPTEEECKQHNKGFNVLFQSKYVATPIATVAYFHDDEFCFEDDEGDLFLPDWGVFVSWCPLPPLPKKGE